MKDFFSKVKKYLTVSVICTFIITILALSTVNIHQTGMNFCGALSMMLQLLLTRLIAVIISFLGPVLPINCCGSNWSDLVDRPPQLLKYIKKWWWNTPNDGKDGSSTQYAESYFSLEIYFFLALGLCGLLAGLAYLLSLSTAQETEKRSEYECGFAPFDSATRLPFDVHFYLVGILFLIFDVEVALLFPWVLTLRTIGWFGFYLMVVFLFVLSIGFLFEWKRGALLWPSRRKAAPVPVLVNEVAHALSDEDVVITVTIPAQDSSIDTYLVVGGFIAVTVVVGYCFWPLIVSAIYGGGSSAATAKGAAAVEKTTTLRTRPIAFIPHFEGIADYEIATQFSETQPAAAHDFWSLLYQIVDLGQASGAYSGLFSLIKWGVYPLLPQILLFLVVCQLITALSFFLEGHNRWVLTTFCWGVLREAFFLLSLLAFFQFTLFGTGPAFNGYFEINPLSQLFVALALLTVSFVLDFSREYVENHTRNLLEYPVILAFSAAFTVVLIAAGHLMSLFFSLVGFSLGLYVLIMYDAEKHVAREAGLKYYYLSALSSALILYGFFLFYITAKGGDFTLLYWLTTMCHWPEHATLLTNVAILFSLVGFFFKLSTVPGHLWAADVYEGVSFPVLAFFMLTVKLAVLAAFINLYPIAIVGLSAHWLPILSLAAIVSILWGAYASVQERKLRRFMAYASINQMGFILLGLTTDSDGGLIATILYIIVYLVMTAAFLIVVMTMYVDDHRDAVYLSDLRAIEPASPSLTLSLVITVFSMAGIPPLAGFFVKYTVLQEAFFAGLSGNVAIGLATSLISARYYLGIPVRTMFEDRLAALKVDIFLGRDQLFLAGTLSSLLVSAALFFPSALTFVTTELLSPATFVIQPVSDTTLDCFPLAPLLLLVVRKGAGCAVTYKPVRQKISIATFVLGWKALQLPRYTERHLR
jgi:NADH-quinone oxidoreductase subunit N